MKLTKISIHRLILEKGCGCSATREYEDSRYTKPLADGKFTPCDKHKSQKAIVEFAGEMLLEALDKEAETVGKQAFMPVRPAIEGDGGVQAVGAESVQRMGVNLPKMRERRDPLEVKNRTRHPDSRLPSHLVTAAAEEEVED